MKIFVARVKTITTDKVYVKAKNKETAEKYLRDKVTMKRIKHVDIEVNYGDMVETDKMPPVKKKVAKKKAAKKKSNAKV